MRARTVVVLMTIYTAVSVASYVGALAQTRSLADKLQSWGIGLSLPTDMTFEEQGMVEARSLLAERIIGRAGDRILRVRRITGLNGTQAGEHLARWRAQIASVYDIKPSPYFAIVTTGIVCPAAFQPVYKESRMQQGWRVRVSLYANDRLTLGACTKELATYHGELLLLYCSDATILFEVEYFTPTDRSTTLRDKEPVESATCL